MSADHLRARSAPEIIDAAVQLARRDYGALVRSALPIFALYVVFEPLLNALDAPSYLFSLVPEVMAAAASAVGVAIAAAAFEGRPLSVRGAYRRLGERAWPALGAGTSRAVVAHFAAYLFVVPGLLVLAVSAPVMAVAMLEPRRGAYATFRRARDLTRGETLRCTYAFALPWLVAYFVQGSLVFLAKRTIGIAHPSLSLALIALVYAAIAPVMAGVETVLYFDLRIRKEAYDVEKMIAASAAA